MDSVVDALIYLVAFLLGAIVGHNVAGAIIDDEDDDAST